MRFRLKESELQYLQYHYAIEPLLGIERRAFFHIGVARSLKAKGVLIDRPVRAELNESYQKLFDEWRTMRYSFVRVDCSPSVFVCVLCGRSSIINIRQIKKELTIDLYEYQEDTLVDLLLDTAEFVCNENIEQNVYRTLTPKVFSQVSGLNSDDDLDWWSNKLDITKRALRTWIRALGSNRKAYAYLCEDHRGEIGALVRIVRTEIGYCGLQHLTPKNRDEQFVMLIGGAEDVVRACTIFHPPVNEGKEKLP